MCGLLVIGSMMGPPLLCFLPTFLLVNSTGSLLVHSGVEPSAGFHVASLCRMVGRAENTFLFSLVFSKGAVLVPGLEAGEEDAMFDATLAAMCGLAPWCRALGWLAPNGFQVFFVPRLAGNAGGRAFWCAGGIPLLCGGLRGEHFHGVFEFLERCGVRAWTGS